MQSQGNLIKRKRGTASPLEAIPFFIIAFFIITFCLLYLNQKVFSSYDL
jgi:preprotein translocase subunit SecG